MKKYLLLFGAGGSLGKGVTDVFLKGDYDHYYLVNRDTDKIEADGDNITKVSIGNLTDEKEVEAGFAKINKDKDGKYFLFTTVGGFGGGDSVTEIGVDDWDKMMNMNLKTSFLIAKHFVKFLEGTQGGSICFTAAHAALNPGKNKLAYSTAKNALVYLAKSLALQGKNGNYTVNVAAPMIIDTPENREWLDEETPVVTPKVIGESVEGLFKHYRDVTGTVLELKGSVK